MRKVRALFLRLVGVFSKHRSEQELADDVESNLQSEIDANLQAGMGPEEARRAALIRFGSRDAVKEAWRDRATVHFVETISWDFRYAVRGLFRNPLIALASILSLALCIGANTAIFSVADAVLFRPLPYANPDDVYFVEAFNRQTGRRQGGVRAEVLTTINEYHTGLSEVGKWGITSHVVALPGGTERIAGLEVTPNYFSILGVRPALGRLFTKEDLENPRTAILTHAAWQQRFGGDPSIVGRTTLLGSESFHLIGVLPVGFVFPSALLAPTVEIVTVGESPVSIFRGGTFQPIVRLESGVSFGQAQSQMETLFAAGDDVPVLVDVRSALYDSGRGVLGLLLASAVIVMLIGCGNLANLFLARTIQRDHEIGMRIALGANRWRVVRPIIFEALLLGLAGAIAAILMTSAVFDWLIVHFPPETYGPAPVGVDIRVVLFAIGLGLVGGLLFSASSVWNSVRATPDMLIHNRRRTTSGYVGSPMIALQVALSILLVFGAFIVGRTLLSVLKVPLGFDPDNLITVSIGASAGEPAYVRVQEALGRRGDLVSVGITDFLPLEGVPPNDAVESPSGLEARINHMSPGYAETLGIRLVQGRTLEWNDLRTGNGAVLVSESAARVLFPGQNPLGRTLTSARKRQLTVVGVVADVLSRWDQKWPDIYAAPGGNIRRLIVVGRARTRDDRLLGDLKQEVSLLGPGVPVSVEWWSDFLNGRETYRSPRFQALVLGMFGFLALLLTSVGIFSVVAFLVVSRTKEMGIRTALGASHESLTAESVRNAMVPLVVGLLMGIVAVRWLAELAEAHLFQVDADDPMTLGIAVLIVVSTGLIAAYIPARRASRVDPMIALRHE